MSTLLQPTLTSSTLLIRPLTTEDFEELYKVASDPKIWEQHPSKNRYLRNLFEDWFSAAMQSKGALVIIDLESDRIIGSSRFYDVNEDKKEIAIGFTFLAREFWGGKTNKELKTLMLDHALKTMKTVWFHVVLENIRSQKSLAKIGAVYSHRETRKLSGEPTEYLCFKFE